MRHICAKVSKTMRAVTGGRVLWLRGLCGAGLGDVLSTDRACLSRVVIVQQKNSVGCSGEPG